MTGKTKAVEAPPAATPPVEINDLAGFDSMVRQQETGRECTIKHPQTGEPLSLKIMIHGKQSRRYKLALRFLAMRQMERSSRGVDAGRAYDEDEPGFLARVCSGWTDCLVDGKQLPFSIEEAEKLFVRFPFILEQVDAYLADIGNFMDA